MSHGESGKIDEDGNRADPDDPKAEDCRPTPVDRLPRNDQGLGGSPRRLQSRSVGPIGASTATVDSSRCLRKTSMLPACYGAEKVLIGSIESDWTYHESPKRYLSACSPRCSSRIDRAADQLNVHGSEGLITDSRRRGCDYCPAISVPSANTAISMANRRKDDAPRHRGDTFSRRASGVQLCETRSPGTGVGRVKQPRSTKAPDSSVELSVDRDLMETRTRWRARGRASRPSSKPGRQVWRHAD